MSVARKHIIRYNALNEKEVTKKQLVEFYSDLNADITTRRVHARMPLGPECIEVEKRLAIAIRSIDGRGKVRVNAKVIDIAQILKDQKKAPAKRAKNIAGVPGNPSVQTEPVAIDVVTSAKSDGGRASMLTAAPLSKITPPVMSPGQMGFITADKAPKKAQGTFTLPGPIGKLLGNLQRYKLEIILSGEPSSGKSELGKQIVDAFISMGDEAGWVDWEAGGLVSKDTQDGISRNVKPANRKKLHVSSEVPRTLEAVKSLAKKFDVVVLDSGTKLGMLTNAWIDQLREEHPDTVWVILMQLNGKGGTRGGSAAEFDAPVVITTVRPDQTDYRKNYAKLVKDRGNPTGLFYDIAGKKIIPDPTAKPAPDKKEPVKTETIQVITEQPKMKVA